MCDQVIKVFPLSPVVRIFFEIAEPAIRFLPVDVLHCLHAEVLRQFCDPSILSLGMRGLATTFGNRLAKSS